MVNKMRIVKIIAEELAVIILFLVSVIGLSDAVNNFDALRNVTIIHLFIIYLPIIGAVLMQIE